MNIAWTSVVVPISHLKYDSTPDSDKANDSKLCNESYSKCKKVSLRLNKVTLSYSSIWIKKDSVCLTGLFQILIQWVSFWNFWGKKSTRLLYFILFTKNWNLPQKIVLWITNYGNSFTLVLSDSICKLLIYRESTEELMLLNCGVGEDPLESLGLQGDPTSQS